MTAPMAAEGARIRALVAADDAAMAAVIRAVMTEYRCTGAGFAIHDPEVDHLSASYPDGDEGRRQYLVVDLGGAVVGGGGFGPLAGVPDEARTCELRKMYFLPHLRGRGVGRALLGELLRRMAAAGYRRCYLETTSWMDQARRLYLGAGFAELPGPLGATGHGACDRFFARSLI